MPRPANPETRARLLEKGAELVSRRGFNAAGVQDITAAAGVPKGSFYNYFASKEAFGVEILTEYWDSIVALYGPILEETETSPVSRIARYFTELADFHASHGYAVGCLVGNMALEVAPSSEEVRAKLAKVYREWSVALTQCLREAQARGELARGKDPKQLAAILIDGFEGAVMRAKVERDRRPFEDFQRGVLSSLLT